MTTFGLQFSIDPLLEEIGKWFKSILNTDNFGKTVNMIHKLKKLGFSEELLTSKISLTPAVIEFVNNSSREDFINLLTAEFVELDMVILKALFRGENNHFDILLNTLAEKIETEEQCEIILDLLQVMLSYVHPEIPCVFSFEVDNVIEKMKSIFSNNEVLLLSAFKFLAHLNKLKSAGLGTPRCVSLEVLQRTRSWRKYSLKQLQSLKDNENIRSWHLAEIVLDWIEETDPPRETVCELRELVLLKLDNDVSRSPYPQYYRYRYAIDADFKRLSHRVGNDLRNIVGNIVDFIRPCVGYVLSNLNSILLVAGVAWFWLIEPSESLLTINGGTVILGLFILNFFKELCFGAFQFLYRWNVSISVRKEEIKGLVDSCKVPVKVKAYSSELSIIRILPFCYCDLQLVKNINGIGTLNIKNSCWNTDYRIQHWYMRAQYDGVDKPFYSVFTHSHSEIVAFLNKRYEQSPKDLFSRCSRLLVYYLFGWSPINLCTLNYD